MNLPRLLPWHEYTVLAVIAPPGGEEEHLIGHNVMFVREIEMPIDIQQLPIVRKHKMRHVEIFHDERLGTIIATLKRVQVPCRCPRKPFPHRWTRACHANQP